MEQGAVFITGAGSGIGMACARRLLDRGLCVFAGARKLDGLPAHDRLVPVKVDVTDPAAVHAAAELVERELAGAPLLGVVNSAGVTGGGPAELTPLDEVRRVMETNFVGTLAVIQAFVPLLRRSRGRIVCVGSIGGRVPAPFLTAYSASKAAVAAMCHSLRIELRPWGIGVVLVEPGSIATPMWDKGLAELDRSAEAYSEEARELYGAALTAVRTAAARTAARGLPPSAVAAVVDRALTGSRPRATYLVGLDARGQAALGLLPAALRDRLLERLLGLR